MVLVWTGLSAGCGSDEAGPPSESEFTAASEFDGQQAREWMDEILIRVEADAISPPEVARLLAYTGVAIYESSVDGMPRHNSLGGQLQKLGEMPAARKGTSYDVATILHAAMGHLLPLLFEEQASRDHLAKFAKHKLQDRRDAGIDKETYHASINRGVLIAEIIDNWASNDRYYGLKDRRFTPPEGDHAWVPTEEGQEPLQPHWSTLRSFALSEPDQCQPPAPHEFSIVPGSEFYTQAYAVWEVSTNLDDEQRTIAQFWSDDPGESSTPPGHWMQLANQMVEDLELDLEQSATIYALLGIALGDAAISCWEEKYSTYLLRPVTYIQEHIDPSWQPLLNTPPFPEYTSGHSTFSGAAAVILTELLGNLSFVDQTHVDRGMKARPFEDFHAAADEAARSRLYGGIHYPMGNQRGLIQGHCVADNILATINIENP